MALWLARDKKFFEFNICREKITYLFSAFYKNNYAITKNVVLIMISLFRRKFSFNAKETGIIKFAERKQKLNVTN